MYQEYTPRHKVLHQHNHLLRDPRTWVAQGSLYGKIQAWSSLIVCHYRPCWMKYTEVVNICIKFNVTNLEVLNKQLKLLYRNWIPNQELLQVWLNLLHYLYSYEPNNLGTDKQTNRGHYAAPKFFGDHQKSFITWWPYIYFYYQHEFKIGPTNENAQWTLCVKFQISTSWGDVGTT